MLMMIIPPGRTSFALPAQRGGVERDQHVRPVGRRVDVLAREVDLEARDARHRAGRGADLGGKIRKRREVVSEQSAVSSVNFEPVICMPSPESPANRIATLVSCSIGLPCWDWLVVTLARLSSRAGLRSTYARLGAQRRGVVSCRVRTVESGKNL
jgi:hypothetical protein